MDWKAASTCEKCSKVGVTVYSSVGGYVCAKCLEKIDASDVVRLEENDEDNE